MRACSLRRGLGLASASDARLLLGFGLGFFFQAGCRFGFAAGLFLSLGHRGFFASASAWLAGGGFGSGPFFRLGLGLGLSLGFALALASAAALARLLPPPSPWARPAAFSARFLSALASALAPGACSSAASLCGGLGPAARARSFGPRAWPWLPCVPWAFSASAHRAGLPRAAFARASASAFLRAPAWAGGLFAGLAFGLGLGFCLGPRLGAGLLGGHAARLVRASALARAALRRSHGLPPRLWPLASALALGRALRAPSWPPPPPAPDAAVAGRYGAGPVQQPPHVDLGVDNRLLAGGALGFRLGPGLRHGLGFALAPPNGKRPRGRSVSARCARRARPRSGRARRPRPERLPQHGEAHDNQPSQNQRYGQPLAHR